MNQLSDTKQYPSYVGGPFVLAPDPTLKDQPGDETHRSYPTGTRGQGPARYHTDQVRPKLIQIRPLCGSNQAKVARNLAEPILAPESRSRGIR